MANPLEANLPSKKGPLAHFNIMVCGASGIGKSSFIELFIGKFHFDAEVSVTESMKESTIVDDIHEQVIREATGGFCEREVDSPCGKFKLRVVDSAGHGNYTDISEWRESIKTEIIERMESYKTDCDAVELRHMGDDQKISREKKMVDDKRIHLMLYFFEGHHTKEQDFFSVKEF